MAGINSSDSNCIDIQVSNKTDEVKTVLVFGRDHHTPLTPCIVNEAWRVVHVGSQGKATFSYPANSSVGAFYSREDGTVVNIGPYPAEAGTTWTVLLSTQYDDGTMTKESKAPPNTHGVYMVYNKPSSTWCGRKLNVGLYKDGKVLLAKRNLRVGDYVELKPTNKLYFCCMEVPSPTCDFDINDVFVNAQRRRPNSSEANQTDFFDAEFSPLTQIDLNHYPNGLDITLQENESSGQLSFIPKPHYN